MSGAKISPKMKKGIKLIEVNLKIKFNGSTFEEAKAFLDEHLSKLNDVDFRESKKPSEKQMKGINFIESMLGLEFTGKTMKDASDFLDAHFEEAKNKAEYLKERKKK